MACKKPIISAVLRIAETVLGSAILLVIISEHVHARVRARRLVLVFSSRKIPRRNAAIINKSGSRRPGR
jgi:hypothetical protein